jgi:hypothetical protein
MTAPEGKSERSLQGAGSLASAKTALSSKKSMGMAERRTSGCFWGCVYAHGQPLVGLPVGTRFRTGTHAITLP